MELTIEQALQQAVAAHKEGKLQDAERLYRAILQSQPAHPDANHNLGVSAVSFNKADLALPLFKTALEANPKIEQFWLSYIDALIKEKQFDNARQVLEQAKKQGVAGEKFNVLEAQLASINKQETVGSASPSQEQLSNLLEYYQNGRLDDAEKLAVHITKDFPKHQFAWKVLGAVLGATGRKSEAVDANQTAVELSPQDAESHNNFGVTLKELGKLKEAEASSKKAIQLEPGYSEAYNNLGITFQDQGKLKEAEASYVQAIKLKPDLAEFHYNLGNVLRKLGRLERAEASYAEALKIKLDYAEAHYNLGITFHDLGKLKEAEASYVQAIKLKPDLAEAHCNLGVTLKALGRSDEAEASYSKALELKPHFTAALMNRWQLLFDKGDLDAALQDIDLCNTGESRAVSLETLFALGRVEEIYERIEMWAELDEGNIRMAALSSFIAEREKKDTAHKFCPNPLSFLYFSNVFSHLKDGGQFVEEIIHELNEVQTFWEPHKKTTIKGFQSDHHINLFANPSEKMMKLKNIILKELETYYLKYHNESCSYIKKWPSRKNLHGWYVILKRLGHQTPHIHPSGWLSGVIYLKVVPPLGKNEGAIEFSLNSEKYSDLKSPKLIHQPKAGDIVFFPSSLHHRTIPFKTDTDRIIVSFDLKPEETS